jgi:hypothetical protein
MEIRADRPAARRPYPGLRAFQKDEADVFFGRDEQIDQLLDKLHRSNFLAVTGESGCGKSSLTRAGLIPALETGLMAGAGARWKVVTMRPGNAAFLNLARALFDDGVLRPGPRRSEDDVAYLRASLRRGPLGLIEAVAQPVTPDWGPAVDEGTNFLLLVDQFEEIFRFARKNAPAGIGGDHATETGADRDEAKAFVDLLLASSRKKTVYVVLTMRSEFLGQCAHFAGLPEALNESQFLTPRLTLDQRREAIEMPARVFRGTVEPELVIRLLNDMEPAPDQLPLMQHALMLLWMTAAAGRSEPGGAVVLRLADYESIGGIRDSLDRHAGDVYKTLPDDQKVVAKILLRCLTERDARGLATRRPAPLGDVARVVRARTALSRSAAASSLPTSEVTAAPAAQARPSDAASEEALDAVRKVVEVFRGPDICFLTPAPPAPLQPDTVLDISHEGLIRQWKTLQSWVDKEADSASVYRQLAEKARRKLSKVENLLGPLALNNALEWKEREKPSPEWAARYALFPGEFETAMDYLAESEQARAGAPGGDEPRAVVAQPAEAKAPATLGHAVPDPPASLYTPPLAVYVVWHPQYGPGQTFAQNLYSHLCLDPRRTLTRGLGIPVYFRTGMSDSPLPAPIPFDEARQTAVVVLVDDWMVSDKDTGWNRYVSDIRGRANQPGSTVRLLPSAMNENAFSFTPLVVVNQLMVYSAEPSLQSTFLANGVTQDLCRLLSAPPPAPWCPEAPPPYGRITVYISYTPSDGASIANVIVQHLIQNYDIIAIDFPEFLANAKFVESIESQTTAPAVLVILTDAYNSSARCRHEMKLARAAGCPIVVVDALQDGEDRGSPHLGNLPSVRALDLERFNGPRVVEALLREILRVRHFQRQCTEVLKTVGPADFAALVHPPDPWTLLERISHRPARAWMYPDPPLADDELALLRTIDDHLVLTTPVLLAAGGTKLQAPGPPLEGQLIDVSISEGSDLPRLGLSDTHAADTRVEFARYLLAAGAAMAYGGYLRKGDFGSSLAALLRTYDLARGPTRDRVKSFLAWPLFEEVKTDPAIDLIAEVIGVRPPPDLPATGPPGNHPTDPEGRYVWARCLTAMRVTMTGQIRARVILGGKLTGYLGKYPSLAEEAELTIVAGKPLYILGGFGGCARAVIRAVRGETPDELTEAYQARDSAYKAMLDLYKARAATTTGVSSIDYQTLVFQFQSCGVSGLSRRNGLSAEENERLFVTTDLFEMISLVLKGLLTLGRS